MKPRLALGLPIALGILMWPGLAFAATGPAPPVDPPVVDPWDTVRPAIASLAVLALLIGVIVVAIRVPAVRPVMVFVAIPGVFAVVALIFGFGVSFAHMDTGMTDVERTPLNIEVAALFAAGLLFGGFAARRVHRRVA